MVRTDDPKRYWIALRTAVNDRAPQPPSPATLVIVTDSLSAGGLLVDFTPFCDELAARIGAKPSARDVRQESLHVHLRFFAAPFVAAQYRLVGPHAKPELARAVINGLPITHPLPDLINLYLRWTMSRILHRILGPEYAPKLAVK